MKSEEFATAIVFALTLVLTACKNEQRNEPVGNEPDTTTIQPAAIAKPVKKEAATATFNCKGTIMSVSEVAVASRINEQIVMLGVEMGQRVHKGQVVVRLDRTGAPNWNVPNTSIRPSSWDKAISAALSIRHRGTSVSRHVSTAAITRLRQPFAS